MSEQSSPVQSEQPVTPKVAVIHSIAPQAPAVSEPKRKTRWWRLPLMFVLPVALAGVGGWYWVTGGRYVDTENAYVQQNKIAISPEISGPIRSVNVTADQMVHKGDLLFTVDDSVYKIAVEQAESAVSAARLQVAQMRAAYQEALVRVDGAKETMAYQQAQFDRQKKLSATGVASKTSLEEARHDFNVAREGLTAAQQAVISAKAALNGNPDMKTDDHPIVQAAIAKLDQARLDLAHAVVYAPADGVISQTANLQVGGFVKAGSPILAVMQTSENWVEANFNETDLTYMKPGQAAELTLDAFPDQTLTGHVASIGAGTGSIFSLLPAQNATGNWVKVVQRVPVRIAIDTKDVPPLQAGLSVAVSVDTGHVRALPGIVKDGLALLGIEGTAIAATRQ